MPRVKKYLHSKLKTVRMLTKTDNGMAFLFLTHLSKEEEVGGDEGDVGDERGNERGNDGRGAGVGLWCSDRESDGATGGKVEETLCG